jgi:hypothetical protein
MKRGFPHELEIVPVTVFAQVSALERQKNGAAGLLDVAPVGRLTTPGKTVNVGKGVVERIGCARRVTVKPRSESSRSSVDRIGDPILFKHL